MLAEGVKGSQTVLPDEGGCRDFGRLMALQLIYLRKVDTSNCCSTGNPVGLRMSTGRGVMYKWRKWVCKGMP